MHATYQQQVITTVTFVREVKVYTHRISTVVFLCQIIDPPHLLRSIDLTNVYK